MEQQQCLWPGKSYGECARQSQHGGMLGDQSSSRGPDSLLLLPDFTPSLTLIHLLTPTPMNWSPCPVATEALTQMTVNSKLYHLPVSSHHCHHLRSPSVVHFPRAPRSLHQPRSSPWDQTHWPREHLGPPVCPLPEDPHGSRCISPQPQLQGEQPCPNQAFGATSKDPPRSLPGPSSAPSPPPAPCTEFCTLFSHCP